MLITRGVQERLGRVKTASNEWFYIESSAMPASDLPLTLSGSPQVPDSPSLVMVTMDFGKTRGVLEFFKDKVRCFGFESSAGQHNINNLAHSYRTQGLWTMFDASGMNLPKQWVFTSVLVEPTYDELTTMALMPLLLKANLPDSLCTEMFHDAQTNLKTYTPNYHEILDWMHKNV